LGESNACLCAYAKAVEMVLQNDSCVPAKLLDDEIATVQQLCGVNEALAEQALVLLHLARWRASTQEAERSRADQSHQWLAQKRKYRKAFKAPVLLVIGGAELMPRRKVQPYFSYVFEALEFFEGTVISGGTTSGIPGVVGDVTKTLDQQGSKRYQLITYLPKKLPPDASVHPHYKIVARTGAKEFSEQELIACWTDVLLSGVPPEKITALGINGGRIADFEYRLALAFGARLGVMRDSGRAAAVLLADPDWNKHPHLCVVPEDKLVVWAFVNRHNMPTLSPEQIDAAAPEAHEFYRQRRWEKGETSDAALKPWSELDANLKNSNREQIAFIVNVLKKQGFRIVRSQNPKPIRFRPDEIEEMAEREHARFVAERISEGWIYGKPKDIAKKISPYLIPWPEVPEHVKSYDRDAVALFPPLLAKLGYEIQRPEENSGS